MKVGIDAKSLARRYTGVSVYVCEVIRHLSEIDHEDEFYLYSNKDIIIDFELPRNFHIKKYRALTGTLGLLINLPSLLKKDGIDVFWGPEHCLPLGRQPFKRVVTFLDLAAFSNYKLGTRYNYLIQRLIAVPSMKCADRIMAISESTKRDVGKYVSLDKIDVIYCGESPYKLEVDNVKDKEKKDICEKYRISKDGFFLFVGSIEPRKNIITIVDGFNKYKSKHSNNHKLVIAGGLGWRYNDILKKIEESPFKEDIIQTGYCSNKEKEFFYRNCISLVFPSVYEGFGYPILEAMSVGKPVITSNVSSMPEVGGDVAFYLNDINNGRELCLLMEKVSSLSEEEKQRISCKSIERSKLFSRRECAVKTLEILKGV